MLKRGRRRRYSQRCSRSMLTKSQSVEYVLHMTFGLYVRTSRERIRSKDRAFSVRQVARRIGVEPAYLSKIERDQMAPPSEAAIRRLARWLKAFALSVVGATIASRRGMTATPTTLMRMARSSTPTIPNLCATAASVSILHTSVCRVDMSLWWIHRHRLWRVRSARLVRSWTRGS